ncbi:hypothetical protein ACFYNZ_22330 [Streptomyces kebangsaanensis]|uniref:Pyruvate phosphate dikinase AMP/ATP-binding domain-containing protein n=1 Tax=Streptomyces kebangsaanensis TaxID=864058 RepID=A0ABW6KW97_9ACTN
MNAPTTYVHAFAEGGRERAGLLGGKGAGPAETTRPGLPVPPGLTVTTEACGVRLATGEEPPEPAVETARALAGPERTFHRTRPGNCGAPSALTGTEAGDSG